MTENAEYVSVRKDDLAMLIAVSLKERWGVKADAWLRLVATSAQIDISGEQS